MCTQLGCNAAPATFSKSPMSSRDTPLTARLESSIARLRTALGEVCGVDVGNANTDELARIEEVLSIANKAAAEAVSIRRSLAVLSVATRPSVIGTPAPWSRDIKEADGVTWTVFAVRPSTPGEGPVVRERYREGWLAFESGAETRRFAPIPADWETLSEAQLLTLWTSAEVAPPRRPSIVRRKLEIDANGTPRSPSADV